MNKLLTFGAVAVLAVGLSGCSDWNNEQTGTLAGAGLGGLMGGLLFHGSGQAAGVVGGAILGGIIGNRIGAQMDAQDRARMEQAIMNQPVNQPVTWRSHANKQVTYTVKPVKNYRTANRYCREYQTTVTIGGKARSAYGKACRKPDGQWQIVS